MITLCLTAVWYQVSGKAQASQNGPGDALVPSRPPEEQKAHHRKREQHAVETNEHGAGWRGPFHEDRRKAQ